MSAFHFLILLRFPPGGAGFAPYPQCTTFCEVRGQLPGDILQERVARQTARTFLFAVHFCQKVFDFWRNFMTTMQILYIDYNFRPKSS